jgi:hypothetical protein
MLAHRDLQQPVQRDRLNAAGTTWKRTGAATTLSVVKRFACSQGTTPWKPVASIATARHCQTSTIVELNPDARERSRDRDRERARL